MLSAQPIRSALRAADALASDDRAGALRQLDALSPNPGGGAADRLAWQLGAALRKRAGATSAETGNLYDGVEGPERMLRAFSTLTAQTPLVRFGHVAANLAILDGAGEDAAILDVGIGLGAQRSDLFRREQLTACKLVGVEIPTPGADADAQLRAVGARLQAEGAAVDTALRFEGRAIRIEDPQALAAISSPGLAINAAFALPHVALDGGGDPSRSRDTVIARIAALRPRVFTLVEPEADHDAPAFAPRVRAAIRHYGLVFEALDALLPRAMPERATLETAFFGREIENVVGCEGADRVERHEPNTAWRARMLRAGMRPRDLSGFVDQISSELGLKEPFSVQVADGALALTFRGAPIVWVSAWSGAG